MTDRERVVVRFLVGRPPYREGEVASLRAGLARSLVASGDAEYVEEPVPGRGTYLDREMRPARDKGDGR